MLPISFHNSVMNHKRKNNKRERTKFIYTGIWGFKKSFKKDYEDKKEFKKDLRNNSYPHF